MITSPQNTYWFDMDHNGNFESITIDNMNPQKKLIS
ncbi:hypothetical protein QFZ33_000777 [Arthrobacter globiformis]|nr:hypothetical protein [Arthrobacter globiformis]